MYLYKAMWWLLLNGMADSINIDIHLTTQNHLKFDKEYASSRCIWSYWRHLEIVIYIALIQSHLIKYCFL